MDRHAGSDLSEGHATPNSWSLRRRVPAGRRGDLVLVAGDGGRVGVLSPDGAVLVAAWLAYEDVQRLPSWLLVTLPVVLSCWCDGRAYCCC